MTTPNDGLCPRRGHSFSLADLKRMAQGDGWRRMVAIVFLFVHHRIRSKAIKSLGTESISWASEAEDEQHRLIAQFPQFRRHRVDVSCISAEPRLDRDILPPPAA